MSVLIKGMKKPKNCYDCPLHYGHADCSYAEVRKHGSVLETICPMVELPDHGRLVDADDVIAESRCGDYWWETEEQVPGLLNEVPTVIPAERSVKVCPLSSDDEVTEYCVEGPCTDEMEGRCPIAERSEDATN